MYANYIGGMISEKFRLIGAQGSIYADEIADINGQDALIAVSLQPCSRVTIQIAEIAKERNAVVVGVTDSPASALALLSDHVLLSPNKSPLFFESYVGTTALIELLIGFLTMKQSEDAAERIEKIEADRVRLGEYWMNRKS